ncbi:MAG: LPP20 family lipoprotein [Candidatus Marinimicrobia bacterium]|nr:LPP20 family lipoprotein [Candidatus Neomarinimicrobiota bacterium]
MKSVVKIFLISLVALLFIFSCGTTNSTIKDEKITYSGEKKEVKSNSQMPSWIIQTPTDNAYLIGIGSSPKTAGSTEHIQKAKNSALNMIAGEIQVKISSEVVNSLIEKGEIVEEEFRERIQAKTQMDLEGYELVENWEDETNFYVYYRLSKEKYASAKKKKQDEAIQLALDNHLTAKLNLAKNNYADAIKYYIKSLEAIEIYLSESLEAEVNGEKVFLGNLLYKKLQDVISDISIESENSKINCNLGQAVNSAVFIVKNKSGDYIENFPLAFTFIRGDADFIPTGKSNRFGKSKVSISKITSTKDLQTLEAKYDISNQLNSESIILNKLLTTLNMPTSRITFEVKKPVIYIDSKETIDGKDVRIARIEPVVKERLSEMNYEFVELPFGNDWEIKIIAEARQGSQMSSLFTSFADLTFSVTEVSTGNEIYKTNLNHVKGLDLNFEKAGMKALENIAKKVREEIIDEFMGDGK